MKKFKFYYIPVFKNFDIFIKKKKEKKRKVVCLGIFVNKHLGHFNKSLKHMSTWLSRPHLLCQITKTTPVLSLFSLSLTHRQTQKNQTLMTLTLSFVSESWLGWLKWRVHGRLGSTRVDSQRCPRRLTWVVELTTFPSLNAVVPRNVNLSFTLFNLYSFNILQLLVNFG